jgi:predicted FMN-binding regulatory protein PaiB
MHTDHEWILQSWEKMMAKYSSRGLDVYDRSWLEKQARATIGVELRITEIQAKSKLSQNRSDKEVRRIASQFELSCPALGERMKQVSFPHVAARNERLSDVVAYTLP